MAVHRMALSPNGLFTDRAVHRTPLLGALSPNAHSGKTMGFHRMHMFTERRRRWRRRRRVGSPNARLGLGLGLGPLERLDLPSELIKRCHLEGNGDGDGKGVRDVRDVW